MYHILICDDEKDIVSALEIYLKADGYKTYKAYNGKEAVSIIEREEIHLVLLDIMMPGMDGIETISRIRQASNVPVIFLTAKGEDADKVLGLNIGADDYVTKPFNTMELVARVKSQLRRYQNFGGVKEKSTESVELENLWMDRSLHQVKAYGRDVKLTPIEFDILFLMASHPNNVFSTDEIFERVWKEKSFEMSNTVMVHIRRLREKIELEPRNAQIIKTVWGVGYKIEA